MKLSTREKWVLGAGAAAVAAILGYLYVVQPLVASRIDVREETAQQRALLEQYRNLAAEKDRYQQRLEQLRRDLARAQELLMKGEKLSLAAAELQGLLHRLGQEAGVTIVRENVLPAKKVDILTQVTVELSVRGDLRALRDFLYHVHEVPRLLTVPRLTLRASHARGAAVPLSMDLQVAGYTTAGEEKG